jgi:hypothetical protein
LGLILTGIAVSQGSTFWYDIIRQLKGEQKKPEAASSKEAAGAVPGGGVEPSPERSAATPPTPSEG